MTDEEINRAIAEACGWTGIRMHFNDTLQCEWLMGCPPNPHVEVALPNYCQDLNAMHEAWRSLETRRKRIEFSVYLRVKVVADGGHQTSFNEDIVACVENATARQRAEAFLRTAGKWREEGEGV